MLWEKVDKEYAFLANRIKMQSHLYVCKSCKQTPVMEIASFAFKAIFEPYSSLKTTFLQLKTAQEKV